MLSRALSLALIKPSVAAHPHRLVYALSRLRHTHAPSPAAATATTATTAAPNLCIIASAWHDAFPASAFYAEHQGRFYYARLVDYMSSGPVVALALLAPQNHDAIAAWRAQIGATKVGNTRHQQPDTLRGLLGLTDTRNVAHGSDSAESAGRELALVFPDLWQSGELKDRVDKAWAARNGPSHAILDKKWSSEYRRLQSALSDAGWVVDAR